MMSSTNLETYFAKNISQLTQGVPIDEYEVSPYARSSTVGTVVAMLQEHGVFVALGKFGPSSYENPPTRLQNSSNGEAVYGWIPQSKRCITASSYIFVLGVRRVEQSAQIYFKMAQDTTPQQHASSLIRRYAHTTSESRLFLISFENFYKHVADVYPAQSVRLRALHELSATPLDAILDQGKGGKKCHAIGQDILSHYSEKGESAEMAMILARESCEALSWHDSAQGRLRVRYVESAWNGIQVGGERWCG